MYMNTKELMRQYVCVCVCVQLRASARTRVCPGVDVN